MRGRDNFLQKPGEFGFRHSDGEGAAWSQKGNTECATQRSKKVMKTGSDATWGLTTKTSRERQFVTKLESLGITLAHLTRLPYDLSRYSKSQDHQQISEVKV